MGNLRQSMTDEEWEEMEQKTIGAKHFSKPVVKVLEDLEDQSKVILVDGVERAMEQMMMSIKDYMDIIQLQELVEDGDLDNILKDLVNRWADKYSAAYRG